MRRPAKYPVLTFVACALVAFVFLERALHPFIPRGKPNAFSSQNADFLQQGGYELIKWHRPVADAFAEARRKEKPILMVIGAPWSSAGRQLDREVLSTERAQRLLDRNFVCIRIDAEEQPDWAGAYLPVGRAFHGGLPDLQIYVLDPEGRMLLSLRDFLLSDMPNENDFIALTSDALSKFEQVQRRSASGDQTSSQGGLTPGVDQANDLRTLFESPRDSVPDFHAIRQQLLDSEARYGGFAIRGVQPLWPQAWMFEVAVAGPSAASTPMERLLTSPVTDPMDGGFYRGATSLDWSQLVFDKVATQNAEMALLMARLYTLTGDSLFKNRAEATLDYIFSPKAENGLQDSTGFILACRIGDSTPPLWRSARSSFDPRRLSQIFPNTSLVGSIVFPGSSTLGPIDEALRFQVKQNPQMAPAMVNLDNYRSLPADLADALQKLRDATVPPITSPQLTLATQGIVAARSIEAARTLGDDDRLGKATTLYEKIKTFSQGNTLVHAIGDNVNLPATLSDYLAYSDACLQDFLSLGRLPSLESGLITLKQAISRFHTSRLGLYNQAVNDPGHAAAPDSNVPQISDDISESTSAMMIRLAWSYGELYRTSTSQSERDLSAHLLAIAADAMSACALASSQMGPFAGGYALDSAQVTDGQAVFVVGKDPGADATALLRRSPFRLIAPAAGPVRPDLQSRAPGYYISIRGKTAGPFSFTEAQRLLVPQLLVGPLDGPAGG